MKERHPGRRKAHDLTYALTGFPLLTMDIAILAVAHMPIRARCRALKRELDGITTLRTQPRFVLSSIFVPG